MIQRSKKTYPKPHPILNTRLMKINAAKSSGQKSLSGQQRRMESAGNAKGKIHEQVHVSMLMFANCTDFSMLMLYSDYFATPEKLTRTGLTGLGLRQNRMNGHRSLRLKRYSQSGISAAARARQQELLELLRILNQNRNDLDPLGNYLLSGNSRNNERDMDAVDLQPDIPSQGLRSSIPDELFDQVDPVISERGSNREYTPEETAERDELSALLQRQLPPEENMYQNPLSGVRDPTARIHLPSSWRLDRSRIDEERDEEPEIESDLNFKRLARLYEAIVNTNRD